MPATWMKQTLGNSLSQIIVPLLPHGRLAVRHEPQQKNNRMLPMQDKKNPGSIYDKTIRDVPCLPVDMY